MQQLQMVLSSELDDCMGLTVRILARLLKHNRQDGKATFDAGCSNTFVATWVTDATDNVTTGGTFEVMMTVLAPKQYNVERAAKRENMDVTFTSEIMTFARQPRNARYLTGWTV